MINWDPSSQQEKWSSKVRPFYWKKPLSPFVPQNWLAFLWSIPMSGSKFLTHMINVWIYSIFPTLIPQKATKCRYTNHVDSMGYLLSS